MKLSGREMLMILGLLLIVLIAGYWFLIFSPTVKQLKGNNATLTLLRTNYASNQSLIDSNVVLEATRADLKKNIAAQEVKLLPELKPEVVTANLSKVFADAGLTCITKLSCAAPVAEQVTLPNGSTSDNSVQWVMVNFTLSGTDGSTPDGSAAGATKIGYDQFMAAIHTIEAINPNSIHVSSISMQETNQGFQFFLASIQVFAYNLPVRESPIDPSQSYVLWEREPITAGGEFGIPMTADIPGGIQVPPSILDPSFFRPFATGPVTFAATAGTTGP